MHWTEPEILTVFAYWGSEPATTTAARVDRSVAACRAMLGRESSSRSLVRGRETVAGLAERSGYDRTAIRRGLRAVGCKVRRVVGPTGRRWFSLNSDQAAKVLEWLGAEGDGHHLSQHGLPVGSWAPRAGWERCRACGTDGTRAGQRHAARGLCVSCTGKERWAIGRGVHVGGWSRAYERCTSCDTDGTEPMQRHSSGGLCRSCAEKARYTPEARRARYVKRARARLVRVLAAKRGVCTAPR